MSTPQLNTFIQLNKELDTMTMQEKLEVRLKEEFNFDSSLFNIRDIKKFLDAEVIKKITKIKNVKRGNYVLLAGKLIGAISSIAVGSSLSATEVDVIVGVPIVGASVSGAGVLLTLTNYL